MFFNHVIRGITSSFTVTASPLYRYPYRNADEAFRGDWKRIGKDIGHALEQLGGPGDDSIHE
jgi:hypothetical protein